MFDIYKASQNLTDLDLQFKYEGMGVCVQWFRVAHFKSNQLIHRHNHSFFELHLMKEGSTEVKLDDGGFTACAGEFYLNAPGVFHEQYIGTDGPALEYCLSFSILPDVCERTEAGALLRVLSDSPCKVFRDTHNLTNLFDMALEEAYYKRVGYFNKIRDIASLLLINTAQCIGGPASSDYEVPLKSSKGDFRYSQIEKFIWDNIATAVTVKQLSDYLHLSERQITRIVRDNAGIPAKELIIRHRVHKAAELINGSSMTISEIAGALGFSSEFYFSQFFRKHFGCSPTSFRKSKEKINYV